MAKKKRHVRRSVRAHRRQRPAWWTNKTVAVLAVLVVAGVLAGTGAFAYGAHLENNNAFCASCHTQPESTYYRQTLAAQKTTLAAFHSEKGVRCIDCHSGKGLTGRLKAMTIGARDMVAFRTGHYTQPAKTTHPLGNVRCTKCHAMSAFPVGEGIVNAGPNSHYHATSLNRVWQQRGGPANTCTVCHPAHGQGTPASGFTTVGQIERGCRACHNALGG